MKNTDARYISRLIRRTLAVVLAGGRGSRLGPLTDWRTKPAVPFAGKFRIIDFTLSNCVNSDIRKACVLTQYKSHSLIKHLMKSWTFRNAENQEFLELVPAQQWHDEDSWFVGTADAVYQSLDIIEGCESEYVLILAGDHIYTMDYGPILATHVESKADFTVACIAVPVEEATGFGVMSVDESGQVTEFREKPADPEPIPGVPDKALASMGIYVASFSFLQEQLERDAQDDQSSHDFGKDLIPHILKSGLKVQSHTFSSPMGMKSYWRDVGTIDAFFKANLEQICPQPPINLHDPSWPILTHQSQLPPAHFTGSAEGSQFLNSMISGGCIVTSSSVSNSILFSNVLVDEGSELTNVLALPGSHIGAGSRLVNVILDNGCCVPEGSVIGVDPQEDAKRFTVTPGGVTLVNREMLGEARHYRPGLES